MAYEKLQASEKQSLLLDAVGSDKASGSYPFPTRVMNILTESVMTTFDAVSDVFPQAREKYIHSVGVVGGIKFESSGDHPYTGIFKGAEHGLIRFSSAKQPGLPAVPGIVPAFTPGVGIKFLRDGRPSSNFVAMPSLDGQWCTDSNFFSKDFSNHVAATGDFALKLIAAKFWQASYCPLMVGLSDLASETEGQIGVFPYQLILHPLVDVQCSCLSYSTCLKNFGEIKVGTQLFEVRAVSEPAAEAQVIGHITLTSQTQTSKFGDESLFFKHQHMEDDFALKPEWLEKIDRKGKCGMGCTGTIAPTISKGCSSPFNSTSHMLKDDVTVLI
jgi:hypothetical protein